MFLGTHHPRLDEKGRLFLPARFRDELAEGLVITKGQEHCLYVWPRAEFESVTAKLRQAPLTDPRARAYGRVLFGSAFEERPDKQGRITVPPTLRNYANLTRDCVVVGMDTRVEIWDAVAWEAYLGDREPSFADLSEEVVPGRF